MNDTIVTVQGWLGSDPVLREAAGVPVANFRVACTPRRFQRSSGQWVDGPTQWYGVSAWRQLADHCSRSLKRGDPVVLQGRLNQRTYVNKSDIEVTVLEIDLITIGHDLSRGVSLFQKAPNRVEQRQGTGASVESTPPPWETRERTTTEDTIAPPSPESEPGDAESGEEGEARAA